MASTVLDRDFYGVDAPDLAPRLLNKLLVYKGCGGRIVEVEAYDGANDPASHAFRGKTDRNKVMFGPPGHLYVYFTYGMHFCSNVVAGEEGRASAVLIRALAPVDGIDQMRSRRPAGTPDRNLASGPAKLCQALGIDRRLDGADLVRGDAGIHILDDGVAPPLNPAVGPRIGIRVGTDLPWRWWVPGDENVSRPSKKGAAGEIPPPPV